MDDLRRHPRVRDLFPTGQMSYDPTRSPADMIEDRKTGSFT